MDERTQYCIDGELRFARQKFAGNKYMLAALVEEVGELAQALINHSRGKQTGAEVYAEAIQVATMAIRVAEEGDESFPYVFEHGHYQAFDVHPVFALSEEQCGNGRGHIWREISDPTRYECGGCGALRDLSGARLRK